MDIAVDGTEGKRFAVYAAIIGSLSMQRFWATDSNRKCALCLLYTSDAADE